MRPLELSEEQRRIVEHLEGGLLVLAPVGSGKTTVLTERLANVTLTGAVAAERILCLTFTNRAARAIRARLQDRYPEHTRQLTPRTFHHLCADILRREAKAAGLTVDFTICDEADSMTLLRRILREQSDGGEAEKLFRRLETIKARANVENLGWPIDMNALCAALKNPRWTAAAIKYQRGLAQWQTLDFGDLVLTVRALFASQPEVRDRWASRFDLVQLDEVQDTHLSEYEVVEGLAERSGNLALFGDVDQTIYEWRGADPRTLLTRFDARFGPITRLSLTQNYRATRRLIAAASAFAESFERQTVVTSAEHCPDGDPPVFHVSRTVEDEAEWVGEQIRALVSTNGGYRRVGVLAPANWHCAEVARALDRLGIPHVTTERTQFFGRAEIKDALAYLRLLVNPSDTGAALRVWEQLTRGLAPGVLTRVRQAGEPLGLRLVDLLRAETFADGDPLGPLLTAYERGRLVVFDVETTGLSELRDEVIEIAALRLERGRPIQQFHAYVQNTVTVGDSIRLHRLDDAFLADRGRPPAQAISDFLAFGQADLLVGHNVGFDLRIVMAHAARLGLQTRSPRFGDTLDLAWRFLDAEQFTLAALARQLELRHRPSHRAETDALATAELLNHLVVRAKRHARQRRALVAREGEPFRPLAALIDGWRGAALTTRPAELLVRIVEESSLAVRYAREPRRLRSLEELARTFDRLDNPELPALTALRELVAYVALARSLDHLDELDDRVPVITIHQSKGLEFDTVFVVGLADGQLPRRRAAEAGRVEEERRLFYVALTRARERLFLSAPSYDARRRREPSSFLVQLDGHISPWSPAAPTTVR